MGFRIGYMDCHRCPQSRASNHPSSLANEAVVQERISAEVRAGRLLGPLPAHLSSLVHVSPVGLAVVALTVWAVCDMLRGDRKRRSPSVYRLYAICLGATGNRGRPRCIMPYALL